MKNCCSLFLFLTLLFCACAKNNSGTAALTGTWELWEASGSIPVTTYAPGNGNLLTFSATTYKRADSTGTTQSGTYNVKTDNSVVASVGLVIPAGQFTNRIIFDGNATATKTFFNLDGDRLTLLSGYFPLDGGSRLVYQKK